MKSLIRLFSIFLAVIVLGSCGLDESKFKQGTYVGVGTGNAGPIKVEVVVGKRHKIVEINVLEYCDTPGIGDAVFDNLGNAVIRNSTTDVDTITGATYTSNGFLDAIEDALKKAK